VKAKTQFAASEGLGGVFFWEGGQDAADASASLMATARAAAEEVATGTAAAGSKADL
jgi:GH18 family chitinase